MAKFSVIISLILTPGLTLFSGCEKKMDRQDLVLLMDQYLEALAKNDPSVLPLASDVKLVENTKATRIGEGLWETATGGPFDLPAVHVFKIKNGEITDIEAIGYIAEHRIKNGWE